VFCWLWSKLADTVPMVYGLTLARLEGKCFPVPHNVSEAPPSLQKYLFAICSSACDHLNWAYVNISYCATIFQQIWRMFLSEIGYDRAPQEWFPRPCCSSLWASAKSLLGHDADLNVTCFVTFLFSRYVEV